MKLAYKFNEFPHILNAQNRSKHHKFYRKLKSSGLESQRCLWVDLDALQVFIDEGKST